VVVAEREAAGGAGARRPNRWRTAMPTAWMASKRVPRSATCQPSGSAFQCSATPNSQTLPSWTVVTWVASVAHITFGASVVMCLSCDVSGRGRARCGESRVCSRISRSTRLRETRMPSMARSRAQTFRWPSPVQGERARSARMAASRSASETAGLGPRRTGLDLAPASSAAPAWCTAWNEDLATSRTRQTRATP
jgi:hypothetical protein